MFKWFRLKKEIELRDKIAIVAMKELIPRDLLQANLDRAMWDHYALASYRMADAMIKARWANMPNNKK